MRNRTFRTDDSTAEANLNQRTLNELTLPTVTIAKSMTFVLWAHLGNRWVPWTTTRNINGLIWDQRKMNALGVLTRIIAF